MRPRKWDLDCEIVAGDRRRKQTPPPGGVERRKQPYNYREERERWATKRDQIVVALRGSELAVCLAAKIILDTDDLGGFITAFGGLLGLPYWLRRDERARDDREG